MEKGKKSKKGKIENRKGKREKIEKGKNRI
jgi:hypothetical protein